MERDLGNKICLVPRAAVGIVGPEKDTGTTERRVEHQAKAQKENDVLSGQRKLCQGTRTVREAGVFSVRARPAGPAPQPAPPE